ncbi:3-keto-5-aminohexanoate cleavage protein [Lichenicoccus sp.]|uniref:3-keto-5-aminohexanoate cleavage protein n=1 Tax=Lichenicoccus sp. TaxID=2781899 RepID=UPI003D0FBAD3
MLIQACLNGARKVGYHPALPLDTPSLVREARACVTAGAELLHLHPRGADGAESLSAGCLDAGLGALRAALPGVPLGISTGEWIESDPDRTLAAIAGWRLLPDFASVNFSEAAAPAVFAALRRRCVAIEAGLADESDAERFLSLDLAQHSLRILIEIDAQSPEGAEATADSMLALTSRLHCPRLLHGFDAVVWPMLRKAMLAGLSVRVGLEDGDRLPDGRIARDNAELVAAALLTRLG